MSKNIATLSNRPNIPLTKNEPTKLKKKEEEEKISNIPLPKKNRLASGNTNKKVFKETTNKTVKSARQPNFETSTNKSGMSNKTGMPQGSSTISKSELQGMDLRLAKLKLQKKIPELEQELAEIRKKIAKEAKEKANLEKYIEKYENDIERKAIEGIEPSQTVNTLKSKISTINKSTVNTKNLKISEKEVSLNNTCKKYSNLEGKNNEEDPGIVKMTIKMSGGLPKVSMDEEKKGKTLIKTKNDLMKFLYKIYCDNINLKKFETQAFGLSKNNDEINSILSESINGLENVVKETENQNLINEVEKRLNEIRNKMETTLEEKQKEYNEQMEKKENDLNFIQLAYDKLNKEYQEKKNDELQAKNIIEGLNSQIENLEMKLDRVKRKRNTENNEENK